MAPPLRLYHPPHNTRLDPCLYSTPGQIFFMTIRSYNQTIPFVKPQVCNQVISALKNEQASSNCRVFVYCLMPDHIHYLVSPEKEGSSVLLFTERFKGKSTNQSWQHGWRGKMWQPRFYDHMVRSEERLEVITEYILQNPVRKGLVPEVSDWPWSGQLSEWP